MLDNVQNFVVEQIVKNSVSCTDDYVAQINLTGVLVSKLGSILAHIVLALFENLAQLNAFLDLSFLLKQLDMFFPGQNRQLEGCVERVHLFF